MSMNKPTPIDEIRRKALESYSNEKWTGSHSPVILTGKGFSYTGTDKVIECSECKVSADLAAEEVVTLPTHEKNCKFGQHLREIISLAEQSNPSTVALALSEPNEVRQHIDENNDFSVIQEATAQCENPQRDGRHVRKQDGLEGVNHFNGNRRRNIIDIRHPTRSKPYMGSANATHNPLPATVMNDLTIYTKFDMIRRAPSRYCDCSKCKGYAYLSCTRLGNQDMYGFPVLPEKTLVLNMKRKMESAPMHPEFADKNARSRSLEQEGITSGNMTLQVEAGFFCNGGGDTDICCFCCGLGLREELLSYDPWREHARWYPVCPFVLQQKTEEFVHDVIVETNMLKEYLQDQGRCSQMSTMVVEAALKDYHPAIVQSTIRGFFFDNGGFPRRDELFSALETKRLWQTW